ncbi:hypothetical protein [Catenulispora rubra]|uniref:hypothetical protein n=1 Tax=Catenulispora rubra TaxID=280293 RepID=UPI00189221E3|nr:hypothetical protein [Catenulispora rubra]
MCTIDGALDLQALERFAADKFDWRPVISAFPNLSMYDRCSAFSQAFFTCLGIGAGGDGARALRLLARFQAGYQVSSVNDLYISMVLELPLRAVEADLRGEAAGDGRGHEPRPVRLDHDRQGQDRQVPDTEGSHVRFRDIDPDGIETEIQARQQLREDILKADDTLRRLRTDLEEVVRLLGEANKAYYGADTRMSPLDQAWSGLVERKDTVSGAIDRINAQAVTLTVFVADAADVPVAAAPGGDTSISAWSTHGRPRYRWVRRNATERRRGRQFLTGMAFWAIDRGCDAPRARSDGRGQASSHC